ncbi:hypothetical protein SPF06_20345 [Sinomonas sp. JGH33]|uniref:Uncharacterized protein n=1 Tax=Sinomonas terricola TaxID=3110330 RepID=A0ABU5TBL0_9MICC|nr:hypothetical protein [Sinomonas sp. JGH33]MEA5457080.1 hypothetical protein [Sinomonas sp. JGH33]
MNSTFSITATASSPAGLQAEIDRAVEAAIEQAIPRQSRGVLVTRLDHSTVTVELSDAVPYGTTLEADLR